jgi:hypothetical protein
VVTFWDIVPCLLAGRLAGFTVAEGAEDEELDHNFGIGLFKGGFDVVLCNLRKSSPSGSGN